MDLTSLGKSTKRGWKICEKCKNKNGLRSHYCKHCNIQLRTKKFKESKINLPKLPTVIVDFELCDSQKKFISDVITTEELKKAMKFSQLMKTSTSTKNKSITVPQQSNFECWLEIITERINQHLEVKLCGKNVEIRDVIPISYFNLLLSRISSTRSADKLCLPNKTEKYERTTDPPLGVYVLYTWSIGNLPQLQMIFNTNNIALEEQKTISLLSQHQSNSMTKCKQYKPILPSNVSVKLKLCDDKREPLFLISWTPKLSQNASFGEVKLRFQYDHFINNELSTYSKAMELLNSFKQ